MRSSSVTGLLSLAVALLTPSLTSAQLSKDNTAPPIDVPTTPVPQGPITPPPAAPPKAPAPKPAPPPPTTGGSKTAAPAEPKKEPTEDSTAPKYNNEGVFKISGSKGPGVVGTAKGAKQPASGSAKTATTKGAKKTTANVAQWPGFRLTEDGGSEVMVEFSSNQPAPTEHRAAGSVTYVFKGAHVIKSNNQNPLLTVHFNTPVLSARLVPKKGELHLLVDLRPGANVTPSSGLRASSDGDGQQFFVKFPSGAWLPKGAENEEISPAPTQKLKNKPESEKKSDTPPSTAPTTPKTESGGKTGPVP
jgi:hypothetical protein